jgi:hypothetical protein
MTKKKTTESKEAVQQEVERRFKDVRTPDGISEVMRAAIIRALKQRLG